MKRKPNKKIKFISVKFDPLGSYTGNYVDINESPDQDVDDL